jgi:hypothetical protein
MPLLYLIIVGFKIWLECFGKEKMNNLQQRTGNNKAWSESFGTDIW